MATYEEYMEAARNADAQGDEAAARQLVQAAMRVRDSQLEPEKSEPSLLERASSFYDSTLKPAVADAYDTVIKDGAGEFVKRINRGVLSFADIPADLAEMAGASPEQTFRLTDLFDGTPLDMTPNPEAWVNKPVVRGQSYGDFVQTLGAFGPSTVPVNSGIKYLDDLIEASGLGRKAVSASPSVQQSLEVARGGGATNVMPQPFTPQATPMPQAQPGQRPKPSISPVPETIKDENAQLLMDRLVPESEMSMIKRSSGETRGRMTEMLEQAKKVDAEPDNQTMPREVIGGIVSTRAQKLGEILDGFGSDIRKAVGESSGELLSTGPVMSRFDEGLRQLRVGKVVDPDTGEVTLDFSKSKIKGLGGAEEALKNIFERLNSYGDEVDFGQLHDDKQWLSAQANYASRESGVNADFDRLIKGVRNSMNDSLRGVSESYGLANDKYAAIIEPFRRLAKLTGDETADLDDPRVLSELARKARGLTNNTKTGEDLRYAIQGVEQQLLENLERLSPDDISALGINPKTMSFGEDINKLSAFAATLDRLYPNMKPTSMQGISNSAAETGADRVGSYVTGGFLKNLAGDAVDKAVDALTTDAARDRAYDWGTRNANRDRARRQQEAVESLFEVLSR